MEPRRPKRFDTRKKVFEARLSEVELLVQKISARAQSIRPSFETIASALKKQNVNWKIVDGAIKELESQIELEKSMVKRVRKAILSAKRLQSSQLVSELTILLKKQENGIRICIDIIEAANKRKILEKN